MGRTGGAARRITRVGYNPSWSPDGTQLAFTTENVALLPQNPYGRSGELWTVTVNTGETTRLLDEDATLPSWSPHNRRIAFTRRLSNGAQGGVWTLPAKGGTATAAIRDPARDWNPVWSPDGKYLYFVSDRSGSMNLWRVPIDEASGKTLAEPESITTPAAYLAHPSLSADGKRIACRRYAIQAGPENLLRHARCHRPTAAHTRWNEGVLLTAGDGIGYLAPDAEVKRAGGDSQASTRECSNLHL